MTPDPVPHTIPHAGNEAIMARASEALDSLDSLLESLPHRDRVVAALDRREAVASSQIEGTRTEVEELFYLEATGDTGDVPDDAPETLSYVQATNEAFRAVRQEGVTAFTEELIIELHHRLMTGTRYADGAYRNVQNWIGGLKIEEARFIPPLPADVPALMADLVRLLQYEPDGPMVTSIIMRMAIVHAQFETIHPFRDGNGRLGRILMRLMLEAESHCPLHLANVLKSKTDEYYDHLWQVQTKDNWTGWLGFLSAAIYTACKQTELLATKLSHLPSTWAREHRFRRNSAAERMLPLLIEHPVITANLATELLDVTFKAANDGLAKLVEAGVLSQSDVKRNRVFRANEVLALLNADLSREVPFVTGA